MLNICARRTYTTLRKSQNSFTKLVKSSQISQNHIKHISSIPHDMALTPSVLEKLSAGFTSNERNLLAQNIVSKSDPQEATVSRRVVESSNHVFSHKVDEIKPMTNQKSSGRCWLFAALNAMRIPFAKERNLDDFEFSQGHLFFWDKVERCNYVLNAVVNASQREPCEQPDGRLLSFILSNPTCDGGQWDMLSDLIKKHGVMPKKCFPETWSCESSRRMNDILKSKLREFCCELTEMIAAGASKEKLQARIEEMMVVIYRVIGICLSIPPATFTWEHYDKSKKYQKVGPVSAVQFYEEFVKPHFDVDNKVCLVSDPRPQNPTGKSYTVDSLGSVVGGTPCIYNNQSIETLIEVSKKALMANEPVWFGCDVGKHFALKHGLLDLNAHDHELIYGTRVSQLSKANRMVYGESQMTHAMLITGISFEDEACERPAKWRVENSWGEDRQEKGYLSMTNEWFREYVYEVVVDKSHCSEEVLSVFKQEPLVLPAWDPMGALAREE